MNLQPLKGFRDFLPEQAAKRQWLKKRISEICESWGYPPMETPTLEPLELFAGQIGEDEKLFFKFTDNGGRNVALRYDQTVPTCRVIGQYSNELTFPFRRYQIQSAFRAENTQKGRYREFVQCDADIFGIESPLADAEVIALSLDIYRQLGFKQAKVLINDRTLLKNLPYEAIVAIDKLEKIGPEGVIQDMLSKGISEQKAREYFSQTSQIEPSEALNVIFEYLNKSGFSKESYEFKPTLARSFSYSTGPIWEVVIPEIGTSSVLGGERFDNLVEKISGQRIPGTGFGLGFDRTLEAADSLGLIPSFTTNTKIMVSIYSAQTLDNSLELSTFLRQAGIPTEMYPDTQTKLEKQLKYAAAKNIPFVAIIGPDEITKNIVTVKDMGARSQLQISTQELITKLSTV